MEEIMQIKDSVLLITGGGNGIGEAIARDFAKLGAKIAIVDMSEKDVERVTDDLKKQGVDAIGVVANVTNEEDTAKFVKETMDAFGKINIVIPCAGIIRDQTLITLDKETGKVRKKMPLDLWQIVIDVNLTGTFLTIRDATEAMVNAGCEGVIIPITSINKQGQVGQLNYSSTKSAVALMPKIIIGEFMLRKIKNIRCAAIAPGYTATPILKGMSQDILQKLIQDVHLGRLIEPDEIASLARHIVKNDAINATTIEITGGLCHKYGVAK
jgi:3-oxoacyl-[acyl-carrier protein] reductase